MWDLSLFALLFMCSVRSRGGRAHSVLELPGDHSGRVCIGRVDTTALDGVSIAHLGHCFLELWGDVSREPVQAFLRDQTSPM